jgi:putative transposase
MEDTDARHEALRRDLAGQRPAEMCRALGDSKPWLSKWLKRDAPTNATWAEHDARALQRLTTKTPVERERLVCESRHRLVQTSDAPRGVFAIQWPLQQLGVYPVPEVWTMHRILNRYTMAGQRAYQPRGMPSPALAAPPSGAPAGLGGAT